jgi:predicted ATPase
VADIPATLRDSLAARLDRLGPAKEVAQFAAVLGREFSWELLKAVTGNDDAALGESLTALADAELIYARGSPPRATYQFKHALVQDSAYEALTRGRRKTLHKYAATVIATQFPALAEKSPELLASHWSRAGETAQAVKAWRAAGDAAYARRAFKEAEAHYREALAILATSPESGERDQNELDLSSALNRVMQLTLGYAAPETIAAATKARALAEKRGSLAHLIREEARIWRAIITAGDHAAASALADHIMELCKSEGENPGRMIFAYNSQVQTRFYTGDLAAVERNFAALMPLIASAGDKQAPGNNVIAIGIGSLTAAIRGDLATARARINDAHAIAARTDNPYDLAMTLQYECNLALLETGLAGCEAIARKLLAMATTHGFSWLASLAQGPIGWAEAMHGNREGLAMMRSDIDDMARSGARITFALKLYRLALGQIALGDTAAAAKTIEQSLVGNPLETIYRPQSLIVRAWLRMRVANRDGALADLREAVAVATSMGAQVYRRQALQALADLEKGCDIDLMPLAP